MELLIRKDSKMINEQPSRRDLLKSDVRYYESMVEYFKKRLKKAEDALRKANASKPFSKETLTWLEEVDKAERTRASTHSSNCQCAYCTEEE